jgi:hypothetical protein
VYRGRRSQSIETPELRVTVLEEGGHIAEILDKRSGVNPLWTPPWPSIEPSSYSPETHPQFGNSPESKLLAGIMGHNLCLDLFGGPSEAEAAAGMTVHGEASVVGYDIQSDGRELVARATLPIAALRFERRLSIQGAIVRIAETVENLAAVDQPIAWTQHVTLGPPFIAPGSTEFRVSATRSKVYEQDFANGKGYLAIGAEFDWPYAPRIGGGVADLRVYSDAPLCAGYTAHLMDSSSEQAWFTAFSPGSQLLFGYVWRRSDFPWLGIWDENGSREQPPWNGETLTRGMEFGVSPMPETRRQMIERSRLFGEPCYRWIEARQTLRVEYCAFLEHARNIGDGPQI